MPLSHHDHQNDLGFIDKRYYHNLIIYHNRILDYKENKNM